MVNKILERKFFSNVEPAFSIDQHNVQEFQFLDNSDPRSKRRRISVQNVHVLCANCVRDRLEHLIVRENARSWVHRSKQQQPLLEKTGRAKVNNGKRKRNDRKARLAAPGKYNDLLGSTAMMNPLINITTGWLDPFNALPKVGYNINHIIEYCKSVTGSQVHLSN